MIVVGIELYFINLLVLDLIIGMLEAFKLSILSIVFMTAFDSYFCLKFTY